MCGIAGYIGTRKLTRETVEECLSLMGRRGPDASGWYHHQSEGRHVFLLHTRLSITDIEDLAGQAIRTSPTTSKYSVVPRRKAA